MSLNLFLLRIANLIGPGGLDPWVRKLVSCSRRIANVFRVTGRIRSGVVLDGTFHIVRLIGEGGMGEVYEARHSRLAGRYAVKVLHPEIRQHPEVFRRFQREAQVTSALRHPGIVQVIDFNVAVNGAPYLVMEYLDGFDLGQTIARQGPLALPRVVDIATQIAAALAAAHRTGVVHRDLKPQNVFLLPGEEEEPERVKVLDFGLSKIRSMSAKLTGTAVILGTPQYMAPEQAEGRDEVDAAADQFSLAAIVYEMLTGRSAFAGETLASVVYQIVYIDPVPLSRLRPDLPDGIQAVVMRALSKKKTDRFPSAWEFARTLRHAARLAPVGGVRDPSANNEPRRHEERNHQDRDRDGGAAIGDRLPVSPPISTPVTKEAAAGRTLALGTVRPATGAQAQAGQPVMDDPDPELSSDDNAALLADVAPQADARYGPADRRDSSFSTTTFRRMTGERLKLPDIIRRPATKMALGAAGLALVAASLLGFLAVRSNRQSRAAGGSSPVVAPSGSSLRSSAPCLMTIGSTPWAHLWLDGKDMQRQTPIVSLSVACGSHRIALKRPDLDIDFQADVLVGADEEFKRSYQIGFPD